ncbi:hypothetical protein N7539_007378 [Penicillium diatomitis]|uniref:Uncharacterized protein n=1 Tax=Penicillium diatomitis TaxID=2819901 RepID=A0A9W9WV00_9EURO|nr:uncharacterized protein N7539_007378 [Penicillium diatomitis]KAJ5477234.1 hypothetical protein N7539_007378 [Penicillium diatomitis]
MTVTSLVMQNRRGHASAKGTLHLPMIAPKEEVLEGRLDKIPGSSPRIRLPPRSRTGCWYDLSAFRDDTPRIMGRMADVKTEGNVVWDLSSPGSTGSRTGGDYFSLSEELPDFSLLTSDEDREKKAESSTPGTYHVVMVPESFSSLPEYAEETDDSRFTGDFSHSATASPVRTTRSESDATEDPNVVILRTFEDTTRRSVSTGRISRISPTSEISDPFCSLSLSPAMDAFPSPVPGEAQGSSSFRLEPQMTHQDLQKQQELTLFAHFRHVVWKQLFPHDRDMDDTYGFDRNGMTLSVDFLEREAARFPPMLTSEKLSHAIMTVSALSLSHSGTGQKVDALQYYQQAFPSLQISLRNNDDLVSDGLFLTHFLLLIYEVAAAEPHGSNLWSHHISRLLHIALLRHAKFGREPHPFILWWICHIDLYALLSGAGQGEFVRTLMDHRMLPDWQSLLYPSGTEGYSVIYSDEHDSLPALMRLYANSFAVTAQIGFLGARLRREKHSPARSEFHPHTEEIAELRRTLARLWEASDVAYWSQHRESLPQRSQEILQQSATLYHLSHLFSYSSMFPHQRLKADFDSASEIDHHASEILRIVEETTHNRRADRHFLVFPLFLAGATASDSGLKMMAMELMTGMEDDEDGMGRNTATTRAILQTIYERQMDSLMRMGHTLDVDWSEFMTQQGLQMVNFGF